MAVHYEVRQGETLAIRGPANVTVKGGEVPLVGEVGANVEPPVLSGIDPAGAAVTDPEFTLTATGADFEAGSRIVLGLVDATTAFVDESTLTTTINPALFLPGDVAVTVRTGPSVSAASTLTFTDVARDEGAKKRRN